jgi:hypothetical protein
MMMRTKFSITISCDNSGQVNDRSKLEKQQLFKQLNAPLRSDNLTQEKKSEDLTPRS